jgi:hypothetical protein
MRVTLRRFADNTAKWIAWNSRRGIAEGLGGLTWTWTKIVGREFPNSQAGRTALVSAKGVYQAESCKAPTNRNQRKVSECAMLKPLATRRSMQISAGSDPRKGMSNLGSRREAKSLVRR